MSDDGPRDKPITTWIRFGYPEGTPFDKSLLRPLKSRKDSWTSACYGEIKESPGERMLVVVWRFTKAWVEFAESSDYQELLASLRSQSNTPVEMQVIDFFRTDISTGLSSHTEVRTVYFPASISSETRQAVRDDVHRLRTTAGYGKKLQHLVPYISTPSLGWIDESLTWKGQDATACVWLHMWKKKEAEDKFKTTQVFPHTKDGELIKPLTVDLFEQDLRDLGALGWSDYHVNFETTSYIP